MTNSIGVPFHVGLVVSDIEPAMSLYSDIHGVSWTGVRSRVRVVHTRDGDQAVRLTRTFSTTGPTHLELIERVEGTIWDLSGDGIHHIGHWVSDVASASRVLTTRGLPLEAWMTFDDGEWRIAFHRLDGGSFVELISERQRGELESELHGATPPN